ncbi:hypothetical protein BGZ49_002179, partial [Haplosporangium sp. Z 27]
MMIEFIDFNDDNYDDNLHSYYTSRSVDAAPQDISSVLSTPLLTSAFSSSNSTQDYSKLVLNDDLPFINFNDSSDCNDPLTENTSDNFDATPLIFHRSSSSTSLLTSTSSSSDSFTQDFSSLFLNDSTLITSPANDNLQLPIHDMNPLVDASPFNPSDYVNQFDLELVPPLDEKMHCCANTVLPSLDFPLFSAPQQQHKHEPPLLLQYSHQNVIPDHDFQILKQQFPFLHLHSPIQQLLMQPQEQNDGQKQQVQNYNRPASPSSTNSSIQNAPSSNQTLEPLNYE